MDSSKSTSSVPSYFHEDIAKQERSLITALVFAFVGLGGCVGLIVYGILQSNTALLVVGAIFAFLMLYFLIRVSFLLVEEIKIDHLTQANDRVGLLAYERKKYAHSLPLDKERRLAGLMGAYIDNDQLNEAKTCLEKMTNAILLDLCSPSRIELLLNEGKYAEAKGLYLSFASRHRNGPSQTEKHTVVALDGLFHSLAGENVTPEEKEDLHDVLDCPLLGRLLSTAPWDEEKRDGEAVAESFAKANNEAIAPSYQAYNALTGGNDRKLQSWLNFALVFDPIILIGCFLIAVLSVPSGDAKPLRNFWILGFAALYSLGLLIFAIIAKKKEPKDKTVPSIIIASILLTISVILSLTALA
jgi:hypothetical protein